MDAFTHSLILLSFHSKLGDREAVFCPSPALLALPSRTYEEGRLVKVNGIFTSTYLRKKHTQAEIQHDE